MANKLPLSDVLANISAELLKAEENAQTRGSSIMQFDECEVEFAVEIEKEGKGGLNVWVVELGAGLSRRDSNVVRVKFKSLAARPLQVPQRSATEGPPLKKQT